MTKKTINVPHNFKPRDYQLQLFAAMDGVKGQPETKKKRAILRWHRRAGKDKACFAYMCKEMASIPGVYYYLFPTYSQGKKALWETVDKDGFKLLDHLPKELIARKSNMEMMIELTNGSVFRIIGTDQIDKIVGTNPRGCVFSEYSLQSPEAWTFIAPILAENEGWAIFNGTPRGRNHMYKMEMAAKNWDDWYISQLTVEDSGLINNAAMASKIEEDRVLHGDDYVDQEYYVTYTAGVKGTFYSEHVDHARTQGRIGLYPHDPNLPVDTFWDLGMDGHTCVWFRQIYGRGVVFIDYLEDSNRDPVFYVNELKNRGYTYRTHYFPWDGNQRSKIHTITPVQYYSSLMREHGISSDIVTVPRTSVQAGIDSVKMRFGRYYFHEGLCDEALNKLVLYRRRYDKSKGVFLPQPVADENSHCADALRMEATSENLGHDSDLDERTQPRFRIVDRFDPYG